jgi:hypothetical protein
LDRSGARGFEHSSLGREARVYTCPSGWLFAANELFGYVFLFETRKTCSFHGLLLFLKENKEEKNFYEEREKKVLYRKLKRKLIVYWFVFDELDCISRDLMLLLSFF